MWCGGSRAHREQMSWRLKGCWDQGTPQLGSEGTGSFESATRAATDQARTRSGRSTSAAAAAFLEHSSAIPAPDRLEKETKRDFFYHTSRILHHMHNTYIVQWIIQSKLALVIHVHL